MAITEQAGNTQVQHTAMLSYGVTDRLEFGVFGRITALAATDGTVGAAGPLVRVRLLKDEQWWPEVAVGALDSEGNGRLTRRTLFTAASKGLTLPAGSPIRSVRGHLGVRQLWQDENFNAEHVTIGYVGGEIELPAHLFVVGEVSTRDPAAFKHTPAAVGLQLRHPSGFGFSLAAVQSGDDDHFGIYIGIGIRFLK